MYRIGIMLSLFFCQTLLFGAPDDSCQIPKFGPPGPTGATGPIGPIGPKGGDGSTGPTGPTGGGVGVTIPHLDVQAIVPVSDSFITVARSGGSLSFNTAGTSSGSSISWNGSDTFTIHDTGNYLISFSSYLNISTSNFPTLGLQIEIQPGSIFIPPSTVSNITNQSVLPLFQIVHFNAGDTFKIVNVDTTNDLHLGTNNPSCAAMITIVQLFTP